MATIPDFQQEIRFGMDVFEDIKKRRKKKIADIVAYNGYEVSGNIITLDMVPIFSFVRENMFIGG